MMACMPLRRACVRACQNYHCQPSGMRTAGWSASNAQPSSLFALKMQPRVYAQAPHDDILIHRHDVEPQADAGPAPPHVFGETLSLVDKEAPPPFGSASHNVLATIQFGTAAAAFFVPDKMSNMLFEPIALNDVLVEPLLQLLSGEVIVAGACSMVLGRLFEEGKLNSKAGQRLNLGLAASGAGTIISSILTFEPLRVAGLATASVVGGATLGICGANYAHINPNSLSVTDLAKKVGQGLLRLPAFSTSMGLCYATLSIAFLAGGLAFLAAPHLSLLAVFGYPASAASTFVWRTSGCYLAMLFPAVTYSLKIAADASKLGSRHAKTINSALLAAAMGNLVGMGPIAFLNQGGTYLTALSAVWAATGVVASAGLLAKRGAK